MMTDDHGWGINRRALLLLLVGLAWFLVWRHVTQLDRLFFQPSMAGVKGLALYEIGDYDGAAVAYRAHLREEYLTERTSGDPAWDALMIGDFHRAGELSEARLKSDPKDIQALLNLGEIALEQGRPEVALARYDEVLAVDPDQPDARLLTSVAYARAARYDEAVDAMNRKLREWFDSTRPTSFLQVLRTTGELSDLPKQERPLCLLAHYHRYLRVFDTSHARLAKSYARKAIKAGDRVDDAYVTLAVIYDKENDQERALETFRLAIKLNPDNIFALTMVARLYSDRGDMANEYKALTAAYRHAPQDAYVFKAYSYLLAEKMGDYKQALTLALASLELQPNNSNLLRRAGNLYGFLGRPEAALAYYQRAVDVNPTDASARESLGYYLSGLGRKEEAMTAFNAALSIDPTRSFSYTNLGHLYFAQGDIPRSIEAFETALRYGERTSAAVLSLCSIYFKAGQFREAAACSDSILSVDPGNNGAARIRSFAVNNIPGWGKS